MKVKTKSKKVNKAWLNDHVNDPYVRLATKEGYRARAAFKLKEIDEDENLIKPGQVIVDLGAGIEASKGVEPVQQWLPPPAMPLELEGVAPMPRPAMIISSTDSTMKRFQVMLTSQLA